MKRTSVSPGSGVYQDERGRFWGRPVIRGRSTWRLLDAVKLKPALKEYATTNYETSGDTFAAVAELYLASGCPDKKLQPRPAGIELDREKARAANLIKFFGNIAASTIRLDDCLRYHKWRIRHVRFGSGGRTVDKDLSTLSNILTFAAARRIIDFNYIREGRPRFQANIRHSVQVAPADADTIHLIADELLSNVRSEVLGWQLLFASFIGGRTSELLRLRLDAKTQLDPGFIQWRTPVLTPGTPHLAPADGRLSLKRSKKGVNPFAIIGPEFAECIECFQRWHAARFPKSPWYFPGVRGKLDKATGAFVTPGTSHPAPLNAGALGHALTRITQEKNLPHITPHGLRSWYVTKRRSDGAIDAQIAAEIGDKTVALMQSTYGDRPENWTGGETLSWKPKHRQPAWRRWADPESKIIRIAVNSGLTPELENPDSGADSHQIRLLKKPTQGIERVVAEDGIEPPTQGFSVTSDPIRKTPLGTFAHNCEDSIPQKSPKLPHSTLPPDSGTDSGPI